MNPTFLRREPFWVDIFLFHPGTVRPSSEHQPGARGTLNCTVVLFRCMKCKLLILSISAYEYICRFGCREYSLGAHSLIFRLPEGSSLRHPPAPRISQSPFIFVSSDLESTCRCTRNQPGCGLAPTRNISELGFPTLTPSYFHSILLLPSLPSPLPFPLFPLLLLLFLPFPASSCFHS